MVTSDAKQPGEHRTPLRVVGLEPLKRALEGACRKVSGFVIVACVSPNEAEHRVPMACVQVRE
jgi:hypothetical protein